MKFDFVVMGATGEQGSIASKDLLRSGYSVLLCGRNSSRISGILSNKNAGFRYVNVRDVKKTASIIKKSGAKIVLNCVELRLNPEVMQACLEANAHYLDLGGLQEMTEKQYKFDEEFRRKKLTALLGCGSTPGIANVMASHAVSQLDTAEHIDLGFGWDSNIKEFVLPYSIESIVYELTTPPVVLEAGKFRKSNTCYYEGTKNIRFVGKQALYCIVHSEVYTFNKYFKKKGLKNVHYTAGFPEHSHKMLKLMIDLGLGSGETIKINSKELKIIDFTREVLKMEKHPRNYKEIENVWVRAAGKKDGNYKTINMECITKTLKGFEFAGSNINTGMTISIIAKLLHSKKINVSGVTAPESCVPHKLFFRELAKRKMFVYQNNRRIN